MELDTLLEELTAREGSDLHLVAGIPPVFRVNGTLTPRAGDALTETETDALLSPLLPFGTPLPFSTDYEATVRRPSGVFRGQIFRERGHLAAAFRRVPVHVPTLEDLGFGDNSVLRQLIQKPRGLILVTGPTGSGKSTTCAAMIEEINRTRAERIITVETSLDYVFEGKQSIVTQRVVGEDVPTFEQGVLSALNSDLDVALIGEMRSLEIVRLALVMAETGHLVFSVMHAETASEAIQRLVEVFPEPRDTIRRMLARSLVAVIAQRLVPRAAPSGRVPVNEILIADSRVRRMIVDGQTDLTVAIEAGRMSGMQTMDDDALRLFHSGTISYEQAWNLMLDRERLGPPPVS